MTVLLDWSEGEGWPEAVAQMAITKGAPLELLRQCSREWRDGRQESLGDERWQELVAANDDLARRGYRVLAVAVRPGDQTLLEATPQQLEQELCFLGLIGLYEPPRPVVAETIRQCHHASIKVTMVTGDYGLTAQAIAHQIGLLEPESHQAKGLDPVRVVNGEALEHLSDQQLRQLLQYRRWLVFARMAPEQKLRLVEAYQALGQVVAITGDGVNDAPALRAADVGVAMGRNGTDVASEAADSVLLDDDFASIVSAVRYGRAVFANIRKFITYILASNVPEVVPFLAMVALRIPAALTVLQILAVDLGTDLLPALALGGERPEPDLISHPPRRPGDSLLNAPLMQRAYLFLGLIQAAQSLGGYLLTWHWFGYDWPLLLAQGGPRELVAIQQAASAVAFCSIVSAQIGNLMACRSDRLSAFAVSWLDNPWLALGLGAEVLLAEEARKSWWRQRQLN